MNDTEENAIQYSQIYLVSEWYFGGQADIYSICTFDGNLFVKLEDVPLMQAPSYVENNSVADPLPDPEDSLSSVDQDLDKFINDFFNDIV